MISTLAVRALGLLVFLAGVRLSSERSLPNPWTGLRLPWTLADEEVWHQANRVAGYIVALYSILFFLPLEASTILWWSMPCAAAGSAMAVFYARALYIRKYGTADTRRTGFSRYEPVERGPR